MVEVRMAIQFEIEALIVGHHFNPEFPKLLDFHIQAEDKEKIMPPVITL